MCFQRLRFGLARAIRKSEGGRRAEDPFRGLRAGPARSSPRLLPLPTQKTTPKGPYPSAEARLHTLEIFESEYVEDYSLSIARCRRGKLGGRFSFTRLPGTKRTIIFPWTLVARQKRAGRLPNSNMRDASPLAPKILRRP